MKRLEYDIFQVNWLFCGQAAMYWNKSSDGRVCMWVTHVRD